MVVDVAGAVGGGDDVLARAHAGLAQRPVVGLGPRLEQQRDVDHHVAHELDSPGDVLALEVGHRGRRGAQQQVGEVVGEDAVDLLGHRAIEGAHPGLDVGDRHVGLGGRKPAGERRVRVAVDEDEVGLLDGDERTERGEHPRRLIGVRAAVDAELALGPRHAELVDEDRRELVVVVLAGVDEQLVVLGAQQARDGGRLDELRAVPDDGEDLQASGGDAQLVLDLRADPLGRRAAERARRLGQRRPVDRPDRVDLAQRRGHERLAHASELVARDDLLAHVAQRRETPPRDRVEDVLGERRGDQRLTVQ
jgi:hypothetical protein